MTLIGPALIGPAILSSKLLAVLSTVADALGGLVSGLLAALQTHLSTSHWVSSASSTVNGLATLRVTVTKNS